GAGVGDHVGVGDVPAHAVARAGRLGPAQRLHRVVRAHVAVAVRDRTTAAEPQAVHHAGAGEPVVGGGVRIRHRVRSDAQQPPLELGRDLPLDGEVLDVDLFAHGREVAGE